MFENQSKIVKNLAYTNYIGYKVGVKSSFCRFHDDFRTVMTIFIQLFLLKIDSRP